MLKFSTDLVAVAYVAFGALLALLGVSIWSSTRTQVEMARIQTRDTPHPGLRDMTFRPDLDVLTEVCWSRYGVHIMSSSPSSSWRRAHPAVPQFRVLGERHSATNVVSQLVYGNFKLDKSKIDTRHTHTPYKYSWVPVDFGITEHKHDEQTVWDPEKAVLITWKGDVEGEQATTFVLSDRPPVIGLTAINVREPYDWVQTMSKEIYAGEKRNKFHMEGNMTYADAIDAFLMTNWAGGDHVYNTEYANLFDMRYRKVCNFFWAAFEYSQNVVYIRSDDVKTLGDKLAFVDAVERWTGWEAREDIDTKEGKYFGYSQDKQGRGHGLEGEERRALVDAVNKYADFRIERALGYVRLEA